MHELIDRIAQGDQAALALLYDATSARVYGLALRMLRNAELAEELVSDVYVQAWRTAASYDATRASVQTWLLIICRSRALDVIRAQGAMARDPAPRFESPDEVTDPATSYDAAEQGGRLRECLARLTPMQRQLVALSFYRGYSHAEISNSTHLPLGSVKTQIRTALRRLREELAAKAH